MSLTLCWTQDRSRYDALFARIPRSNLLQDWAYGDAKAAIEGWRAIRAILSRDDRPVGLIQVLAKSMGGVVRLGRINRGPLWLEPQDNHIQAQALSLLRARWRWFTLGALFMAPELDQTQRPLLSAFRPRAGTPWCSAWLDLTQGKDTLRAAMKGNWRNKLGAAEKAGLTVSVSSDMDWLFARYAELQADKGFSGVPQAIVHHIHHHNPGQLTLLVAELNGEKLGAVLLARHGRAATYLIGWNGEQGRRLKAANLLVWQAMLRLPDLGVDRLDLGGIDPVNTPGVAEFKRGLNGAEYTLAGEFLSL